MTAIPTPLPLADDSENHFNKPEACRACTLFQEPGPVPSVGNRGAKILYVGEAPGAEEVDWPYTYDRKKHGPPRPGLLRGFRPERFAPFVGGAGRIRKGIFADAGLDPKIHVFTANVVKCRPPGNRLPTEYECACCAKFLIADIEDIQPNLIIAAGELPLNVLTGKKKIGNWRGVVTEGPRLRRRADSEGEEPYKVFPTWHPAFIMRQQYNWGFAVHDMARAAAQSHSPEIRRVARNIERKASIADHADALLRYIRERGATTFDFETSWYQDRLNNILMVGLTAGSSQAYVFDWTTGANKLLQEILDDPAIEVCGQNILNFDLPLFEEKGGRVTYERVFDTLTAFHLCNSAYGATPVKEQGNAGYRQRGAEKDLTMIASCHTDMEYWKAKEDYKGDLKGVCGLDCLATDESAYHKVHGLKAELKSYGMLDLYYKRVLPVHPVLQKMTKRGVKVDEDRAMRWSLALNAKADELEATLKQGLGYEFNINSPKQMMELLYEKLRLPVQYLDDKKKGRRPTANAEAIETLAAIRPDNAILSTIVDIRHLRKMDSTFVQIPVDEQNRVHPSFGCSKAATGRFNSWNPNAQNVPEEMRDIWVPDSSEHVLISADWSQIEWRLAMVLSGDEVGLNLLVQGVDNHKAVAAETLGIPLGEVTDEQRYKSKFIVYGLGYGRGADSIAAGHGFEKSFVQTFIRNFSGRFNRFWTFRDEQVALAMKQHYLANAFMRRRWWWTREVTEVYNFPMQSNAADMMYKAIIDVNRQLPKDAHLILTVHDELVVHAPKDIAKETAQCVKENMQQLFPEIVEASSRPEIVKKYYPNGWYCPTDLGVGTNWKMTKSKDPGDKDARRILKEHLEIP
jgi:uracil-DNA glycosylase family 4